MKAIATTSAWGLAALLAGGAHAAGTPSATTPPITPAQHALAAQTAQLGVPVSDLAPHAPDRYTVQRGDTLWRIAGMFLRQPWRWPELWGMNRSQIANPHWIYPDQTLYLERRDGWARLQSHADASAEMETIKLSPRMRNEGTSDLAVPALQLGEITPFLTEPLVVDADTLSQAPRLVATSEGRVLMAQGDRAYGVGTPATPLTLAAAAPRSFRVFRQTQPLQDPVTGEVLGYEAQYLGQAQLLQGERQPEGAAHATPTASPTVVPATLHIVRAKEEIRAGDRLLPEPPRQFTSFVPHAPGTAVDARVVSLYTSTAMRFGTQHQVIAINQGARDGMAPGTVLSLVTQGAQIADATAPQATTLQLPDEENGLAMVFRTFDRVSYALILDIRRGVQVGDRLTAPR